MNTVTHQADAVWKWHSGTVAAFCPQNPHQGGCLYPDCNMGCVGRKIFIERTKKQWFDGAKVIEALRSAADAAAKRPDVSASRALNDIANLLERKTEDAELA